MPQFAAAGLNFGYSYGASPIIRYDGETAPGYTMGAYTPSTVPGCRAPHFCLADGASVYDRLSTGYTAICAPGAHVTVLAAAAELRGIPFAVVEAEAGELPAEYDQPITLVRQDQTVVWRGGMPTAPEAAALWEQLRGAA